MAKLDPLTRLGNRRMLEHQLVQTCEQTIKEVVNYGVILLDIDHFGLFNNCYGHLEVDIALMRIGNILSRHAQSEHELFCRIGGEEFLLYLPIEAPRRFTYWLKIFVKVLKQNALNTAKIPVVSY